MIWLRIGICDRLLSKTKGNFGFYKMQKIQTYELHVTLYIVIIVGHLHAKVRK